MTEPACNDEATALAAAADLADDFEDFRAAPYRCPAGVWTIGYGSTRDEGARPVTARTPPITRAQAQTLMARDMRAALRCINGAVEVLLQPHEEAALLSFIYNVGEGGFRKSTLLRLLNAGDFAGAAAEFEKWNRGGGRVLGGLVRRREAERRLFETGITP